jgi:hypothetical protein
MQSDNRYAEVNSLIKSFRSRKINENVIEKTIFILTEMSESHRQEVKSRMTILLTHLIKYDCQRQKRSPSWKNTIRIQRYELDNISKSLKNYLKISWQGWYSKALKRAISEMKDNSFFPPEKECPWTLDQILDIDFWPE